MRTFGLHIFSFPSCQSSPHSCPLIANFISQHLLACRRTPRASPPTSANVSLRLTKCPTSTAFSLRMSPRLASTVSLSYFQLLDLLGSGLLTFGLSFRFTWLHLVFATAQLTVTLLSPPLSSHSASPNLASQFNSQLAQLLGLITTDTFTLA